MGIELFTTRHFANHILSRKISLPRFGLGSVLVLSQGLRLTLESWLGSGESSKVLKDKISLGKKSPKHPIDDQVVF